MLLNPRPLLLLLLWMLLGLTNWLFRRPSTNLKGTIKVASTKAFTYVAAGDLVQHAVEMVALLMLTALVG